jgi:hypothetical protein
MDFQLETMVLPLGGASTYVFKTMKRCRKNKNKLTICIQMI